MKTVPYENSLYTGSGTFFNSLTSKRYIVVSPALLSSLYLSLLLAAKKHATSKDTIPIITKNILRSSLDYS